MSVGSQIAALGAILPWYAGYDGDTISGLTGRWGSTEEAWMAYGAAAVGGVIALGAYLYDRRIAVLSAICAVIAGAQVLSEASYIRALMRPVASYSGRSMWEVLENGPPLIVAGVVITIAGAIWTVIDTRPSLDDESTARKQQS